MQSKALSVGEYIEELPVERKQAFKLLRVAIIRNLPAEFTEIMRYDMPGFCVLLDC